MISSVSTKSTGFSTPGVKYSNTRTANTDGNPHPMGAASQNPATMGKDCGCEYHEVPSAGIEKMGVGSQRCNDAACEVITKHPTTQDLSQAGTLGSAKAMR